MRLADGVDGVEVERDELDVAMPGCAAVAQLSMLDGRLHIMLKMDVTRCRFVVPPVCAALVCALSRMTMPTSSNSLMQPNDCGSRYVGSRLWWHPVSGRLRYALRGSRCSAAALCASFARCPICSFSVHGTKSLLLPSKSISPSILLSLCCFLVNFSGSTSCPICLAGKVELSYCTVEAHASKASLEAASSLCITSPETPSWNVFRT